MAYTKEQSKGYINEIKGLVEEFPDSYARMITASSRKPLMNFIISQTPLLSDRGFKISTKCFWVLNGLKDFPKCQECGNPLKYNVKVNRGYGSFCSQKCRKSSLIPIEKGKATKKERYGDECYNNPAKAKETFLAHFGVSNPNKNPTIREKIRKTCRERFGVDHNFSSSICKAKRDQTWLRKYGTTNPRATRQVQAKYEQTCLEKYGVRNVSRVEEVKQKKKETFSKKYGCSSYIGSRQGQAAITKTFLKRYGVEHPAQNHEINKKSKRRYLYQGIYFSSSWELALYIYLEDHGKSFEYQPKTHLKYRVGDKVHTHLPDFQIDGKLYEIKGDQFLKPNGEWRGISGSREADAKAEAKRQVCLQNGVEILYKKDIKKYLTYIHQKYGPHYLLQFRCEASNHQESKKTRKE